MLYHLETQRDPRAASRSGGPERTRFIHRTIIAPMLLRRRRRAAIADLEKMPDHLLADIGITRDAIPRAVEGLISSDARAARPQQPPIASVEAPREPMRRAA